MQKLQGKPLGYLMVFMAGILWGSVGLFVSELKSLGADSILIAFTRIFFTCVLLIPVMLKMGGINSFKIDFKGLKLCCLMGLFSQALLNILYNESIRLVGVATASVLMYTAPIFVMIMSWLFFKEQLGKAKYLALVFNIIGCIFTVTGGNFKSLNFVPFGVIAGIGGGLVYAMLTIISKLMSSSYKPMTVSFYSFVFGWLFMLPIAQPWLHLDLVLMPKYLIWSITFGIFPGVFAYLFYMNGIAKGLEASKVPVIASIETVVAAIIGVFMFNESFGIGKFIGIFFVFLSIMTMNNERLIAEFSLSYTIKYTKKKFKEIKSVNGFAPKNIAYAIKRKYRRVKRNIEFNREEAMRAKENKEKNDNKNK